MNQNISKHQVNSESPNIFNYVVKSSLVQFSPAPGSQFLVSDSFLEADYLPHPPVLWNNAEILGIMLKYWILKGMCPQVILSGHHIPGCVS